MNARPDCSQIATEQLLIDRLPTVFLTPQAVGPVEVRSHHRKVGTNGATVPHEGADRAGEVLKLLDGLPAGCR